MKAQTSIEVLILLGGAILVAIIVGMVLKGMATNTTNTAQNQIECTALDCSGCKAKAGCAGYDITGNIMAWSAATGCDSTEETTFGSCKIG